MFVAVYSIIDVRPPPALASIVTVIQLQLVATLSPISQHPSYPSNVTTEPVLKY